MSGSETRALQVARGAAIAVVLGALFSPPVANIAAVIMLVAFFFVSDWRERLRGFATSRFGRGILVFAAALALGTVVAAFNPQGIAGALRRLLDWRTLLVMAIAFSVFDSDLWRTRLATAFVVFTGVAAVIALIAYLMGWQYNERYPGVILRNTVTQAMAFAVGAFFAGVLLVTRQDLSMRQKVLLAATVLLLVGQLVFVQLGRSGQLLLAVLIIASAAQMLSGVRRVIAIAAIPVLAALAFAVSPVLQARFSTALQETEHVDEAKVHTSMGMRVVIWQNTLELVRERPLLGYGLGGMRPAYAAHVTDRASGWKAMVTEDPHNQFLWAWMEAGLPGLLAFLFLLVSAALQPAPTPWRQVAVALVFAWSATSLLSSHFQTFNEGHLIAIFLGAFLAPAGVRDRAAQDAANAPITAAATSS